MIWIDWLVLFGFMVTVLVLGIYFSRRSSKSTEEFFLSGRKLPWWLAGTSMIATNFNSDTALHQSRKARMTGLAGCWFYWTQIIGMIGNSIIFAKLWRRTRLVTAVEFYDIRYHGTAAAAGRIISVFVRGLIINLFGVAFGLMAIIKICNVMFDLPAAIHLSILPWSIPTDVVIVLSAVVLAMAYSAAAGMWGVVVTDLLEFAMAITCSYILLFIIYSKVGWAGGLSEQLSAFLSSDSAAAVEPGAARITNYLSMVPKWGFTFMIWCLLQPLWLLTEAGPVAQRYMAAKDEKQAALSGIWRVINHFIFRAWPWYVGGLISLILLKNNAEVIRDPELAYPILIREYLPAGLVGLMLASFFGAFMSTIDTQMHNFGSIFVNDLYRPYIKKAASERHYIWTSRFAIIGYTILACIVALSATSILDLFRLFIKINVGAALLLLLRWFWWRVNIWADISAQISAVVVTLFVENDAKIFGAGSCPTAWLMEKFGLAGSDSRFSMQLLLTMAICTVIWLIVMYLTKPEKQETLVKFYRRVRPYGFWGPVAKKCPDVKPADSFIKDLGLFALGMCFIYSALFCVGYLFLAQWIKMVVLLPVAVISGTVLICVVNRTYATSDRQPETLAEQAES